MLSKILKESAAWLEAMEPGPWKDQALYQFLASTGEHQAQAGADLMNRERFIAEFAIPWEETDGGEVLIASQKVPANYSEEFYDTALSHFLNNALANDTDLVFESAEAFYDPALKKEFQLAAKEVATGGFTPISAPAHSEDCGPDCSHEQH